MGRHRDASWARPTAPLRSYVSADVSVGGHVDALRFARDTPCPDLRVIMNGELGPEEAEALYDQVLDAFYPLEDDGGESA